MIDHSRRSRVEHSAGADVEWKGQIVADAVGKEQLGNRERSIIFPDPQRVDSPQLSTQGLILVCMRNPFGFASRAARVHQRGDVVPMGEGPFQFLGFTLDPLREAAVGGAPGLTDDHKVFQEFHFGTHWLNGVQQFLVHDEHFRPAIAQDVCVLVGS